VRVLPFVCALSAIVAFTVEMLLADTGIRAEVAQSRRSAAGDSAGEAQEPPPGGGDTVQPDSDTGSSITE
jgi:hypothetical protein